MSDENIQSGSTILIIDDNPQLLSSIKSIIELGGHKATTVATAEDAIDLLQASHFDLVITDLLLPGMSGIELSDYIKEKYPQVKIQLISAYSDAYECEDTNLITELMAKPFRLTELLKKVNDLLSDQSAYNE